MKKFIAVFAVLLSMLCVLCIVSKPFRYGVVRAADKICFAFSENAELAEKNAELYSKCRELEEKLSLENKTFGENYELKKLLGIKSFGTEKVTARIFNGAPPVHSLPFAIDRGSADGVAVGCCAVADGGMAGIVTSCGETWAEITPVMSEDFNLTVTDCSNGKSYILRKNRLLYAGFDDNVRAGDVISTSGMSDTVPGGIKIGRITEIKKNNGGNAEVTVEPYVDVREINYVVIPL